MNPETPAAVHDPSLDMPIRLRGRVVVITGSSAGIGRATALAFAREGCHVVIAARRAHRLADVKAQVEAQGARCLALATDVADAAQVQRLLDATIEHFGRVDIWINNAGSGLVGGLEQTEPDDMERLWRVNYLGVFYGCRAALAAMRRQESGHIMNVSSLVALFPLPLNAAYTATKCAVHGLTEALGMELEGTPIRVTSVLPNVTETDFADAMVKKIPDSARRPPLSHSADKVAARIVACARRPRPTLLFLPLPPLTLALFHLFPGLWRIAARRYVRERAGPGPAVGSP